MVQAIINIENLSNDTLNRETAENLVVLLNSYRTEAERKKFMETASTGIKRIISLVEV